MPTYSSMLHAKMIKSPAALNTPQPSPKQAVSNAHRLDGGSSYVVSLSEISSCPTSTTNSLFAAATPSTLLLSALYCTPPSQLRMKSSCTLTLFIPPLNTAASPTLPDTSCHGEWNTTTRPCLAASTALMYSL
ncbi:14kDa protein [Botrytis virus X]|uniref:Uncharacterized ORF4 protein n=1 Tax=Botrytis virus X (isolate Botrytis cinerea/New Zealand/Howitt/2006) TaxID=686947 RepID=ORF4_BOTVX|nr:14kDa protein [Botrytis virus X]Q6YNQ4.1 RecName: Full=Uncharacterized ORF4 protein [Botrytis virus X NZL/Howitt]AAL17725.1 14kDa protein [Botrytis virus X]